MPSPRRPHANRQLSIADARRIALAAQGFGSAWGAKPTVAGLRTLVRRLGLIQIDFVNVVLPAHYHVPYSRLGPYRRELLDELVYRRRHCIEHWAHEASIVPVESYPLLRYRRERHRVWPFGFDDYLSQNPAYAASVLDWIRDHGVATAADLPDPPDGRKLEYSWYGTIPRAVLEAHFGYGRLAIAGRHQGFARAYDLPHRIVPQHLLDAAVAEPEAKRLLLDQAAQALGVATLSDLADYFRMKVAEARGPVTELIESGVLQPVAVEGWNEPAFLHRKAPTPKPVYASAVLSPFDPLIFTRKRTARLFAFDYRFEIFVPQAQRRWGAFVLPFLHNDRLAARADCKLDRQQQALLINNVWLEPWADPQPTATALSLALRDFAQWLGTPQLRPGTPSRQSRLLRAVIG